MLRVCYLSQWCSTQQQPGLISGETCVAAAPTCNCIRTNWLHDVWQVFVLTCFCFHGIEARRKHQGLIFAESSVAKSQTCILASASLQSEVLNGIVLRSVCVSFMFGVQYTGRIR